MGIFRWIRNNTTRATDHTIGSNHSFLFSPTSAGREVNERTAMQMTAVYSCVRILAEAIAAYRCTSTSPVAMAGKRRPSLIRSTGCCTMSRTRR